MSWSSVRILGLGVVWLAVQTGCGGSPTVNGGTTGGTTSVSGSGGSNAVAGSGGGGGLDVNTGGTMDTGATSGTGGMPTSFVCGNGMLEPGEFCDDGNTANNDGCSGDCQVYDPDYNCSPVGQTCTKVVICGDGTLQGDELCDDGNTMDMDGCSADCGMVEDGFVCVRPGKPCVPVPVCGDGKRDKGEGCDDGQNPPMSNDGCDAQCQLEPSYYCPTAGQACIKLQCGDGVRTPDEACDDHNTMDGDGCSQLCQVEAGFHCNVDGCLPICGDGLVVKGEDCDDHNRNSSDGCSAACTEEPFFGCSGQPSVCVSTISCANDVIEPGEVCSPGGVNGCAADCKSVIPKGQMAVCGDGVLQKGEACESQNFADGCNKDCTVKAGWTCPQPGVCFQNPCGNGTVEPEQGEGCDPPNVGKGCNNSCQVESGWTCTGAGPSVCTQVVCGDKKVEGTEQCDDGSPGGADDGCKNCVISSGWVCPAAGKACQPRCGDGQKLGAEECDDGNLKSGDGCNAGCVIEPGFTCPTVNKPCAQSVCGDGTQDAGEGCDDHNLVAGDGCGPTCQKEPTIKVGPDPKVSVACGDGLVTGKEDCDDGNATAGDGCSDTCTFETPGWTCTNKLTLPKTLDMRVLYRDFKGGNALTGDGHPDFQYQYLDHVDGMTGVPCTTALNKGKATPNCGQLDTEGKPALSASNDQSKTGILSAATFNLWYRDDNKGNVKNLLGNNIAMKLPFARTLTLTQTGGTNSETYVYDSMGNNFYPLDGVAGTFGTSWPELPHCGAGNQAFQNQNAAKPDQSCNELCDAACQTHDYNFTTELRYFFQYKGGETLSFTGDDDVWVYVNGRLAVDIGGLHQAKSGQVVLGDDGNNGATVDSDCSAHAITTTLPDPATCYVTAERNDKDDDRFGLTKGGVYEIVLFHAERHTTASDFKLTLQGFLAPRTSCVSKCGDGFTVGGEFCDDGPNNSDTVAGACRTDCTARNYCGDKILQTGEQCDDGTNITLYKNAQTPGGACAPGCKNPAFCGDASVQRASGELCDLGAMGNTGAYGGCTAQCKLGGYCGDGSVNGPEACDLGAQNGQGYGPTSCNYDCTPGPHCGDGIVNDKSEECDKADQNGVTGSGCTAACKLIPGCGDGIKQMALGEQCDSGVFNKPAPPYGGCTDMCMIGPHCGDGMTDTPYEECDNGAANNDTTYDGCTTSCDFGPRCGDAVVHMPDEDCDNGFNNDDYMYTPTSCAQDCVKPPFCGDNKIAPGHELCDDGDKNSDTAYNGCTTKCDYGPFCGDAHTDMPNEMCDNGVDNVAWAAAKGACGYDCQPAPYCGDGTRNGPEQCDLGADKNDGSYGACNKDCTFAPRCGDGVKQATEECDDGPTGSLKCSVTCKRRDVVQ